MPAKQSENIYVAIQKEPIDEVWASEFVRHPAAGGMNMFAGTTRNHHEGKRVLHLHYDCYEEMALKQLQHIAERMVVKFKLEKVWVVHRIGPVSIGEASIVVAVSAAHRKQVFGAIAEIMELIKKDVPIWKKETYESQSVWKEELMIPGE